jgi:hypothetical protein
MNEQRIKNLVSPSIALPLSVGRHLHGLLCGLVRSHQLALMLIHQLSLQLSGLQQRNSRSNTENKAKRK